MTASSTDLQSLGPIVYGILLVWGLADCFYGHWIFKFTVSVLGIFAGALLGVYVGYNWFDGAWLPAVTGMLVGGIAGALLTYYCIVAAVALFGGLFGALMIYIAAEHSYPDFSGLAALAAGLICAVVAAALMTPMIRLSTAYTGAFRAMMGVWFFATGMDVLALNSDHTPSLHGIFADNMWLTVATLGLGTGGLWFQWKSKS